MNVVQLDKSVIRDLLYAWHKKKNIKCPTCKTCVFQYYGTPHSTSVQVKYEIVLITHHVHLLLEIVKRSLLLLVLWQSEFTYIWETIVNA